MSSNSRGKLAGFSLPVPNETRLQELHALAQRKQIALPGPGAYEVVLSQRSAVSHRRPHHAALDGPFLLGPGQPSLRCQQMGALMLLRDSGQAPGAYDGPASKDATSCLVRAPTPSFGTGRRAGTAPVSAEQLCLSLSRSISSGLNWVRPVPLVQLQQHLASPPAAAAGRACTSSRPATCQAAAAAQPSTQQHSMQQPATWLQQQQQHMGAAAAAAASAAIQPCPSRCGSPPRSSSSAAGRGDSPSRCKLPWQLAKRIAEWDEVAGALRQQQAQQLCPVQQQQHKQCQEEQVLQTARRSSCQGVVLEQQQVLQHSSAARAAETADLLAARRKNWQELSRAA